MLSNANIFLCKGICKLGDCLVGAMSIFSLKSKHFKLNILKFVYNWFEKKILENKSFLPYLESACACINQLVPNNKYIVSLL